MSPKKTPNPKENTMARQSGVADFPQEPRGQKIKVRSRVIPRTFNKIDPARIVSLAHLFSQIVEALKCEVFGDF
jgi:hypothetical protein